MKALTWDAVSKLYKEIVTGRIFTASSEPGDIADGDLWVDSSTTPVLKAKVAGVIYEVVGAGGGGGGYMEGIEGTVSLINVGDTLQEPTVSEDPDFAYQASYTETVSVVLY